MSGRINDTYTIPNKISRRFKMINAIKDDKITSCGCEIIQIVIRDIGMYISRFLARVRSVKLGNK